MIDELIRIARGEVGVREVGGANRGPRVVEFQRATWLEPGPWPWCAAFTCWVLREALKTDPGKAYIRNKNVEQWRCRDASAFGWIGWAKAKGLAVGRTPRRGDFVVYDFNGPKQGGGHIGLVEAVLADGRFRTVEGNTNGEGSREGDGVYEKTRSVNSAVGFIRLGAAA